MMITQPHKPEPSLNIFTEGINYFSIGEQSIWGRGDNAVVDVINDIPLRGCWLDLASGDGRYSSIIIDRVETVIGADIDRGALSKLIFRNRRVGVGKLGVVVLDMTKALPFSEHVFNGVICTGILHLFSEDIVMDIFAEVSRILYPGSHFILDFATDVRRYRSDGTVLDEQSSLNYSTKDAMNMLMCRLGNFRIMRTEISNFEDNLTQIGNDGYRTEGNFIMIDALLL